MRERGSPLLHPRSRLAQAHRGTPVRTPKQNAPVAEELAVLIEINNKNQHTMKKETEDIEDDFNIDDGFVDFDVDFDALQLCEITDATEETRYTLPKRHSHRGQSFVCYSNAEELARKLKITEGMRCDAFINGSFIFGDFIEAFLVENHCKATEMTISSLSLSQNNVDSLAGLMNDRYIEKLNLMLSTYFWANERQKLIPYIYEKLDKEDRFQLSISDVHTKTCHFKTLGGKKIVIHGSANLRSSGNIENITIEENPDLYDFYENCFAPLAAEYATINKAIRSNDAWNVFSKKYFSE